MSQLLNSNQKAALAILASAAYAHQTELGQTIDVSRDEFRQIVVHTATGGRACGLREATNDDYATLKAHFLQLAGRDAEAVDAHIDHSKQKRKQLLWVIEKTALKAGFNEPYILKIVGDRFETGANWRDDLTEPQLLQLSFTLSTRSRNKRQGAEAARKTANQAPF